MLAAGTGAQASFAALALGLPVLAPALRERYELSLSEIGVVLAAQWVGALLTLLPWGLLADRLGERAVLATGLTGCGAAVVGAAFAPGFPSLVVLLGLAGAAGASVNSASGRAVMSWFGSAERGLALGIRQTAVAIGGLTAAIALPLIGDLRGGFLFLAGVCFAGAIAGAVVLRGAEPDGVEAEDVPWTLRDTRLWRLCFGSSLYVFAQIAIIGFVVLFLHDERGLSTAAAAAVLAGVHVGAAAARIAAGRWSDRLRARIVPLRRVGVASFATVGTVAVLVEAPLALLVPAFVVAGALSMSWNGLAFTAAAELAGRARSGAAIGFQQSVLSALGIAAPVAFAAAVSSFSWRAAFGLASVFPLVGWWLLRPLAER